MNLEIGMRKIIRDNPLMQRLDFSIAIYMEKLRFLRKMASEGFARIDSEIPLPSQPIDLFRIWYREVKKFEKIKLVDACCVATIRSE